MLEQFNALIYIDRIGFLGGQRDNTARMYLSVIAMLSPDPKHGDNQRNSEKVRHPGGEQSELIR
jgi:hypothetical protein